MKIIFTLSIALICSIVNGFAQNVTVSGRSILVNGAPYQIKGVCYSPHAIGAPEWTPDWSKVSQDITMMKAAGVNTIRTYRPLNDKGVLDAFANAGIKIIIGFTLDETRNGSYASYINTYKTHPAILMWVHGNEFNYHPDWFGNNLNNWYSTLNSAAGNTRNLDPNHPVATVHGELPDANAINSCPNVQVWGMNIYRIDNPGPLYSDWAARSGKPMFIGESGADSYPDANAPATAIPRIYNTVKSNTSICSGIAFFAWVDEWWKSGNNGAQDTGGFPNGGVPYDGFANEEYWGVVDIYRNPKPGYHALKTAFGGSTPTGTAVVYKDCNYTGTAVGLAVGDYNYGALYARGVANEDISSLTVTNGYEVVLYENDNFTGASVIIKANNSCLVGNGWNDRTTSLKVRAVTVSGVATVFRDCNYTGHAVALPAGDYNFAALSSRGVADNDVSSLRVNSGYEVVLYENDNFSGAAIVIGASNTCLVAQGWNDRTTSLRVRAASTSFTRTIQAESYNAMNGVQTAATNDVGGGSYVGWIDAGDWMAYNSINIPYTGTYLVEYRVASQNGGGRLSIDLNAGAVQLGAVNIPSTGSWTTWTTVSHTVTMNAGTYNIGIFAQFGGFNINWFRITRQGGTARMTSLDDSDDSALRSNSTQNNTMESGFEFYPNPAEVAVYIKSTLDFAGGEAKIFDALGIEISSSIIDATASVDVSSLKSGLYTIVITKDGSKISRHFMKQ